MSGLLIQVEFMFYKLVNEIGNGRIEFADISRRKTIWKIVIFRYLHLQACWKVGVLNFPMPKGSVMPL